MARLVRQSMEEGMDWGDLKRNWALGGEAFIKEMVAEAGAWMARGGRRESYAGEPAHLHDEVRAIRARGQSHNSNILTRVSLEHSATACLGPHGDAMGMEHEKNGASQAALIASRIFRTLVWVVEGVNCCFFVV
jgi:hypothetical protein